MKVKRKELFVAVVCKGKDVLRSQRPEGGWEAYLGHSRKDAIQQALRMAKVWGTKYTVFIGRLSSEARAKNEWELVRI